MVLVVGATGLLGTEICKQIRENERAVRALVRPGSAPEKVDRLRGMGVDLIEGDLKEPSSLKHACRGVDAVISTASSTLSRQEGDSIETVDRDGQLALIDVAHESGADHFVFVSFRHDQGVAYPLAEAKRSAEERLKQSGMAYTILQASYFMEIWLGPALGFDPLGGQVRIYGDGRNKLSWIAVRDVARFAVRALGEPRMKNRTVEIGGPEALSPLEVVHSFEAAGGPEIRTEHVPEEALRAQYDEATDPLQKSFAALMLHYAAGDPIDMTETRTFLDGSLISVRDYVSQVLSTAPSQETANA